MDKVYIGKIVNTHGVKGELRIRSDFEFKDKVFKILLYDLSKKYFNDPRHTIDYLYMNGFIKQNYDLIDDFNEFVYNDMKEVNNTKNVIR